VTNSAASFDASYYAHFYTDAQVHDQRRIDGLVNGIVGFATWLSVDVKSVLDVGAGMGAIRKALQRHHPTVRYRGTDISKHACKTYGHLHVDISTWKPKRAYDLSVCLSVLQYLDDQQIGNAIDNLAAATRSLLYLEIPTRWDRDNVINPEATDMNVHWRTGRFYQRLLTQHFQQVGAGLWLRNTSAVPLFELERL
jgi:trans-aconitate methyltransferase